ncbi:MAG: D-alanyl-D-alanine carboxypeptidase/D-alanyl-D-alanine-endopeptidase [Gemmatimonadetes bacterium]|jgi:D-alanyl-D-alanine carboxypeptidase/D-alanyl-D-alanine-endopeptidase (penicillin-binding protein 4)|nr:D-alanyl-D-alanine carboxypeptidase/D-alanyl-D-alanine-endopeptidase [Gemmatimonadota bacterium]
MTAIPAPIRRTFNRRWRTGIVAGTLWVITACATAAGGSGTATAAGAITPGLRRVPAPSESLRAEPNGSRTSATARRALAQLADSLLGDPMFRSAHWGVLVVDAASGDTLYSRNAGKLFMPASNQKLITGATALALLGGDFRFETRVLGASTPIHGILTGDLAVIGSGDPSVSDSLAGGDAMAPMRALADSLAARGITEVTGRLIRGGDAFPDSTLGYGWAWDDLDYDYSAPVDELFFNEGFARVTIVAGRTPGSAVTVRTSPAGTVPRIGRVEVSTAEGCCMQRSRVEWYGVVRDGRPQLDLRGEMRPGDSVTVAVALRHSSAAWLDAFGEALAARGITVRGGVEANAIADTAGLMPLATRTSPPLREILPRFEKPSQNQLGEILFKTLGRARTGVGTADSARRVVERQLVAWGADSAGFAVRDGSGLSRHDYLSPETIVRVLDAMRRHAEFRTFYDALPVAGVDGTIRNRMRGTPAQGNVHAKTGTLDKARALSGYVTTADGRLLLFSMLANNHVVPNREVERVQDTLAAFLAGATLGAP